MRLGRALPWVAGALVLAAGVASWPFTVDDAYVLARYARRIAQGAGYTMNEGPPTDGVTGPLALVPGLLGQLGWGDPLVASKAVGLACMAAAAALVTRRALDSRARAAVTAALVASGSTIGAWAVAGLETGLATLAFTVAALSVAAGRTRASGEAESSLGEAALGEAEAAAGEAAQAAGPSWRRGAWVGVAIAALAWLRPELALACGLLLVVLSREDRRAAWVAVALAVAGAASIIAFRLVMFDAPLPLSAHAKPPDLIHGFEYVARGVVIALGVGGAIALALAAREGGRAERVIAGLVAVHLFALVLAGGDWMPSFRLFAPVLPIYALAAGYPIASRLRSPGRRVRGAALLLACVAIPTIDLAVQLPRVRDAGTTRETRGAELADWLATHADRVAMVDVGYVAFRSGVEVIDLGGITDPAIGRLPGGHLDKRIDPGTLRALDPDTIVLHASAPPRVEDGRVRTLAGYPVERRVAEMAWVRAEMRVVRVIEYAPRYWYVILQRR